MDAASAPALPQAAINRLTSAIQRNPQAAFVVFALVHVAIWTIVPAILQRSLQLDAIEGVAYGRDWQLSYWKHPPLPWLLMDITHRIFGTRLWGFFLLGQLAAVAAFWATWRLGREFLTPLEAFVAVVLLDGNFEYSFNTSAFNHNILELPFFTLAGWSLYRAFVGHALRDWLLVGLWFALAFYTKYQVFVLLVPALLFSVVDPQARRCWGKQGPYIAALVCAGLCAPQAIWMALVDHYSAIKFPMGEAEPARSLFDFLSATAVFVANGLFYIIPVAALFLLLVGPAGLTRQSGAFASRSFALRYLTFLALGPIATCVAIGLLSGRNLYYGWSALSWCFISLYLMVRWHPIVDRPALRRLLIGWCGFTGLYVAAKIAFDVFLIAQGYLIQSQFPGEQFSALVTNAWHDEVGTAPLPYVVGDFWAAGNVILFSPERPRMFESGDPTRSPRIDSNDIRRRGAVILFGEAVERNKLPAVPPSAAWLSEFPAAEPRAPFVIRQQTLRGEIDWVICWALLKPQEKSRNPMP